MALTKNDFRNMIAKSATAQRPVRLTVKHVRPVYGRFVDLGDAAELANKGWYRFVLGAREEMFSANPCAANTKMYSIDSVMFIEFFN
jgi:hypothetical protein